MLCIIRISNFASRNRVNLFLCGLIVVASSCAWRADAQTVATYNFEDGTADGWISFFGATTPVATNAAAYAGSYSLLTTTSSSGTGGPSISSQHRACAGCQVHDHRLPQADQRRGNRTNANFTIKRTDPSCSGGTCYRHDRHLSGAGVRCGMGADRRHIHRQHHGNSPGFCMRSWSATDQRAVVLSR